MKPEYINVDQIDAILSALEELKGSVAAIDKSVGEMKVDLSHVKEQTTKTNGRVDGLEERESERAVEAARESGRQGEVDRSRRTWEERLRPVIWSGAFLLLILGLQNAAVLLKALTLK